MSDTRPTSDQRPTREFYVPATFQFSTEPGRIERFLTRLFRQRGAMDGRPKPAATEYDFYAPGTTRDAVVRPGMRPRTR